jgi:hypothetical protein
LHFPLRFGISGALVIQEDSWISNFSMAGGWYYLALVATVVGGRKNTHAKKMCSGKCNSQDLVLGEEHTASHRKILKILPGNAI